MSLIEARNYESAAELRQRYSAVKKALWGHPPKRPAIVAIELPHAPEPDPPPVETAPELPAEPLSPPSDLGEDDYAELLAKTYSPETRPQKVLRVIAHHHNLTVAELTSESRVMALVLPRQIVMFIMVRCLGISFPRTALWVNRTDHTTIFHGVRKVTDLMRFDAAFDRKVRQLIADCGLEAP